MRERYADTVEFFVVYIQEAHPTDGWQVPNNLDDAVLYSQPTSSDEREAIASACTLRLDLSIPTLVDDMENSTDQAFGALPDRLYLIGSDGRVVYKSAPGPFGFRPDELESSIVAYLGSG
jgi:hypothetical protein